MTLAFSLGLLPDDLGVSARAAAARLLRVRWPGMLRSEADGVGGDWLCPGSG